MLEEYLKQMESFITPKNYNTDISNNTNLKTDDIVPQVSVENKNKIEDYLKKHNIEGKGRVYDHILDNPPKYTSASLSNLTTQNNNTEKINPYHSANANFTKTNMRSIPQIQSNTTNQITNNNLKNTKTELRNKSLSPTKNIESLNNVDVAGNESCAYQKKIHEMNIKSMNYRYEISQLKQIVESHQQTILHKDIMIQKLEKLRENDAKYLLKLETMVSQKQKPETNSIIPTNVVKIEPNVIYNKCDEELKSLDLNFNDKKDVKDFILKTMKELNMLKDFQINVFEISKNYDSINENIIEGMNLIQSLINSVNKSQRLDHSQFQLLITNFEKITQNIQKTLEVKQLEYNLLIQNKEKEIQYLNEEFLKANQKVELIRKDRMHDQKIISDLQTQNAFLNMKLSDLTEISSNSNRANNHRQNMNNNLTKKKLNPMRESVEKMVRNFEKNLDMSDKTNVNFLENLNYKLKY